MCGFYTLNIYTIYTIALVETTRRSYLLVYLSLLASIHFNISMRISFCVLKIPFRLNIFRNIYIKHEQEETQLVIDNSICRN